MLAGCGDSGPPVGVIGHVATYFGGVSADEPQTTVVGRDVLSAGGTAADAAVAMYFTMAVTLPSAAGLGGGGVCVVYDVKANKAETLDFRSASPSRPAPEGRWTAATPGNVRGMFALHARYGVLRWEELVQPGERLARFGVTASRALARSVDAAAARIAESPEARRTFAGPGQDRLLSEGDIHRRVELAATIGRIRNVGPGDLYTGVLARSFVERVQEAGGWLTVDDMRDTRPVWRGTVEHGFGSHRVHFADGVAGGHIAAALWSGVRDRGFPRAEDERLYRIADIARSAYRASGARADVESGSAGFVVMDRGGNAVACGFTMNEPFGSLRFAGETGILIARPARDPASADAALVPVVMANHNQPQAFTAAVGAGNSAAPVAVVSALMRAMDAGAPLREALAAFRAAPGPVGDVVLLERDAGSTMAGNVAARGVQVYPADALGRVNLMYCAQGINRRSDLCEVRADPRGHGYAINAEN